MNLLSQEKKKIIKIIHTFTDLGTLDSVNVFIGWADDGLPKAARDVSARAKNYLWLSLVLIQHFNLNSLLDSFTKWTKREEIPVLAEIILMNHNYSLAGTRVSLPRIRNRDDADNPQQTTGLVKQLLTL